MKILIAEDDTASRLVLEATLRSLGHQVLATPNGKEAWELQQRENCPVVISDWMMPVWDGLELCRAIRRQSSKRYTIVLLLTARGGKTNYLEAINAGADDFLTKPFDEEQLAARLLVAERMLGVRLHVEQLEELLPICAYCKRIRDEGAGWRPVEEYLAQRSGTHFSHGICPECTTKFFGES